MIEPSGHSPEIYGCPDLTPEDRGVLDAIHAMRRQLASAHQTPRRWTGGLRRTMLARAIRGSNSIEGYLVDEDDAAAALDDEEPMSADEQTFAEIRGYRQALGYVLQMAADDHFIFDTSTIRSMHFMMLSHDLSKLPGKYRVGPIYVRDERTGRNVYDGPVAESVPGLMESLAQSLRSGAGVDPIVQGALAHLNLVMIHPFKDGNGRMARTLQTLVLARQAIAEPAFSSIEEWLGANTDDYYRALAITGGPIWSPRPDPNLWISFNLRAHHMQAQTVARRFDEASATWERIDQLVSQHGLPPRTADLLYEATLGYRLRRSSYMKSAGVEHRTATRDLGVLAGLGLLTARGETRGRLYVAGPPLAAVQHEVRATRRQIEDPYPHMRDLLLR